jgi:hypothetical protein
LSARPIGSEARGNAAFSEVVCEVAFLKMYRLADVPMAEIVYYSPLVT